MSYLEELLPEFRKGAKIRRKDWDNHRYVYFENNTVWNEDTELISFGGDDLTDNSWEIYQEPIDWDYIIEHKCLCWFWNERFTEACIGYLSEIYERNDLKFVLSDEDGSHSQFRFCRPVRRDEVNFYENKKSISFTLLTEKEIWGDKALEVMKNYGISSSLSDLAVLLGGMLGSLEKSSNRKQAGFVWSASSLGFNVRAVLPSSDEFWYDPRVRTRAARPTLPSSETSKIRPNEVRTERLSNGKKVKVCTWGEYPQTVESDVARQNMLENNYLRNTLQKTDKVYTFDARDLHDYDHSFQAKKYEEYTYQGEKYIRVFGNPVDSDSILANNEKVIDGKAYWVKVEPVEWLKDPSGVWVAKEALFAGVQFDRDRKYNGDFNSTDMKKYLDTYFANEIM